MSKRPTRKAPAAERVPAPRRAAAAVVQQSVRRLLSSFNVLFLEPRDGQLAVRKTVHQQWLEVYWRLLTMICCGQRTAAPDPRINGPDAVDLLNHLVRLAGRNSVAAMLRESVWDAVLDAINDRREAGRGDVMRHALAHAARVFELGVTVLEDYVSRLRRSRESCERLAPVDLGSLKAEVAIAASWQPEHGDDSARIIEYLKSNDRFAAGRAFRTRGPELVPASFGDIRPVDQFYGYIGQKKFFHAYFSEFAAGQSKPPLLLSGLPGLGKTHLTIAYALAQPQLTLVAADHAHLESHLEDLVAMLGRHFHRRFVLFFDDVDTEGTDWSAFRAQVSGYLPFPSNIAIVVASNYDFPANVRSRCMGYDFHSMDPAVCREMIGDYLRKRMGLEHPSANLISVIAADFTNEYVNGPLLELSPRSLIRYLEMLEASDERRQKLYEESLLELVRQPIDEVFTESNQQVLEGMKREGARRRQGA